MLSFHRFSYVQDRQPEMIRSRPDVTKKELEHGTKLIAGVSSTVECTKQSSTGLQQELILLHIAVKTQFRHPRISLNFFYDHKIVLVRVIRLVGLVVRMMAKQNTHILLVLKPEGKTTEA